MSFPAINTALERTAALWALADFQNANSPEARALPHQRLETMGIQLELDATDLEVSGLRLQLLGQKTLPTSGTLRRLLFEVFIALWDVHASGSVVHRVAEALGQDPRASPRTWKL